MCCLHSATWWRRHWERGGVLDVELADTMPDGWRHWLTWQHTASPDNHIEIQALTADHGRYLGYIRVIGRRRPTATLDDPITSIPVTYTKTPLLRDAQ